MKEVPPHRHRQLESEGSMSTLGMPYLHDVLVIVLALAPVIVIIAVIAGLERRQSRIEGLVAWALDCPEWRGIFGIQLKSSLMTGTCRVEIDGGDGSLVRIGDVVQKLSAKLPTGTRMEVGWSRGRAHLIILSFGLFYPFRDSRFDARSMALISSRPCL